MRQDLAADAGIRQHVVRSGVEQPDARTRGRVLRQNQHRRIDVLAAQLRNRRKQLRIRLCAEKHEHIVHVFRQIQRLSCRLPVERYLSATGTIQPANQYNVTSSVQGDVLSCTFEEGDTVKKGDTLYEIDKTDAQNQIEQAKLQLEQSRNSYN